LKIRVGETTPDGRFTLERVYCVGNCAVGPSLMIDEDVYGRVEAADVARLLDSYR
jgi:NADH:ubiquinone oxidoreductase subunit E